MLVKAITKSDLPGDLGMQVFFLRQRKKKASGFPSGKAGELLRQIASIGDFKGGEEETLLFYHANNIGKEANRYLAVGLGAKKTDREMWRRAGGAIAKSALQRKIRTLSLWLPDEAADLDETAECLCEGLVLGSYTFNKYKKVEDPDDQPVEIDRAHFIGDKADLIESGLKLGRSSGACGNTARDLGNEPANKLTPEKFALFAEKSARKAKLSCAVLGPEKLRNLGMGGILGVSQGSAEPPRLVVLEYKRNKKAPTILLVGKGLTFDSGGLSLKPGAGMEDMKYDMCGGAAVLAAMMAIGNERPAGCNVAALIPLSENLVGPSSLKPGDIITIHGGKTVEVINTDAEGRLLLADALAYGVERYKPAAVIDVATLTGAAVIALGHHRCALMANDERLAGKIEKAGKHAGEPCWRMPLAPEYGKQMKSALADLRNVSKGRDGGSITAAAFLQEFVGKTPWAHLDIAGTAWNFTEKSYIPAGPSGFAARTLLGLLRDWR